MSARTEALTTTEIVQRQLRRRRSDLAGQVFQLLLLAGLLISLLFLVVLLFDIVSQAIPTFQERGADVVTGTVSSLPERAGVSQGISGSLWLVAFVVILAFPLGIGAAIYLEEYAADTKLNRFINVNVRNLAGVPSVVFGLLGLALFVKLFGDLTGGRSVMSAGITLAILVLPIVIITSAEALRAVPNSIREAGYGVGATKWEVIRSHVLPSAAPGILTGTVLSLSRAIGETAPLLMVGAVSGFFAVNAESFIDRMQSQFTALPVLVYNWSRLPDPGFREDLVPAAIVILLVLTLSANAIAILLRNRYDRKW
ncbi:MAG: phosphate ABC transporter permease PstA [Actinomycetota bacterium]